MRYAVLLRGVNLGPNRRVGMADLREAVIGVGYRGVATYAQSGNLVLEAEQSGEQVAATVRHLLQDIFGMEAAVVVRSGPQIEAVIEANPFAREAETDPKVVHAMFLEPMPASEAWESLDPEEFLPDRFHPGDGLVYLHLPDGMARTRLPGALEGVAGDAVATTRNWRTVEKVAQMMP